MPDTNLFDHPEMLDQWREYADRMGSDVSTLSIQFKLAEMVWTLVDAFKAIPIEDVRKVLKLTSTEGEYSICRSDGAKMWDGEVILIADAYIAVDAWANPKPDGPLAVGDRVVITTAEGFYSFPGMPSFLGKKGSIEMMDSTGKQTDYRVRTDDGSSLLFLANELRREA